MAIYNVCLFKVVYMTFSFFCCEFLTLHLLSFVPTANTSPPDIAPFLPTSPCFQWGHLAEGFHSPHPHCSTSTLYNIHTVHAQPIDKSILCVNNGDVLGWHSNTHVVQLRRMCVRVAHSWTISCICKIRMFLLVAFISQIAAENCMPTTKQNILAKCHRCALGVCYV